MHQKIIPVVFPYPPIPALFTNSVWTFRAYIVRLVDLANKVMRPEVAHGWCCCCSTWISIAGAMSFTTSISPSNKGTAGIPSRFCAFQPSRRPSSMHSRLYFQACFPLPVGSPIPIQVQYNVAAAGCSGVSAAPAGAAGGGLVLVPVLAQTWLWRYQYRHGEGAHGCQSVRVQLPSPASSAWLCALTHSAIRPSQQWDAIAGWDGPFTNLHNILVLLLHTKLFLLFRIQLLPRPLI